MAVESGGGTVSQRETLLQRQPLFHSNYFSLWTKLTNDNGKGHGKVIISATLPKFFLVGVVCLAPLLEHWCTILGFGQRCDHIVNVKSDTILCMCLVCLHKSCDEDKDKRYNMMQVDDIRRLTMTNRWPRPRLGDDFFKIWSKKRKIGWKKDTW